MIAWRLRVDGESKVPHTILTPLECAHLELPSLVHHSTFLVRVAHWPPCKKTPRSCLLSRHVIGGASPCPRNVLHALLFAPPPPPHGRAGPRPWNEVARLWYAMDSFGSAALATTPLRLIFSSFLPHLPPWPFACSRSPHCVRSRWLRGAVTRTLPSSTRRTPSWRNESRYWRAGS